MLQPALNMPSRPPLAPAHGAHTAPASFAQNPPARPVPRPDPGLPQPTDDGSLRWSPTILKDKTWDTTGSDGTRYKFTMGKDGSTTMEVFDKADQGKPIGSMVVSHATLGWSKVVFRDAQENTLGTFRISELFEPGTFRLRDSQDKVLRPGQGTDGLKLLESWEDGTTLVRFAGQEVYLSGAHHTQQGGGSDAAPVETLRVQGDNWSVSGTGRINRDSELEVEGHDPASGRPVLLSPKEYRTPETLALSASHYMLTSDSPAQQVYDSFIRSGVGGYGTPGKVSAELKDALDQALDKRGLSGIEEVEQEQLRTLARTAAENIQFQADANGDAAVLYDEFVASGAGGFGTRGTASPQLKLALDTALAEQGVADAAVLKKMGLRDDAMIELLQGRKDYDGDKVKHFEGRPGEYEEDIGEISNLQVTYKTFLASGGRPDGFLDYLNEVAAKGGDKAEFLVEASQGWYDETDGQPKDDGSNVWSPFEHTTLFGWHIHGDADNRSEFLSQLKLEGVPVPG